MTSYNYSPVNPVDGTISISDEYTARQNSLTMIAGGTEMLRVGPDGFYVRGEKVPADDKE